MKIKNRVSFEFSAHAYALLPSELLIVQGGSSLPDANIANSRGGNNVVCGTNGVCVDPDPFGGNDVNVGCGNATPNVVC